METLENMFGKLTTVKGDKVQASGKYSSQTLYGATKAMSDLRNVDPDSTEGIAAYKTLTGTDPKNFEDGELSLRKEAYLAGGQADLGVYIDKHFESVVGEVDEPMQMQLAYSFCPTQEVKDPKAKAYNAVRKTVSESKERITKIKEAPGEFVAERLQQETPLMARYLARFKDKLIEVSLKGAERRALSAITEYTPGKFITETRSYLSGQPEEIRAEETKIREAIQKKIQEGNPRNEAEAATLIADEYKKLQELGERYPDAELGMKLTQETVSYAVGAIGRKVEEEKAAKAATQKKTQK